MQSEKGREREIVLGVGLCPVSMEQALRTIEDWISKKESNYVCLVPVHSIMDSLEDESLREIINSSGMTTPDGMPLVWYLRARGHKHVERVYGPDLMLALCAKSQEHGYRHFLYGGSEETLDALETKLKTQFPSLILAGSYSPPFRTLSPEEDAAVRENVKEAGADIVWVALGAPKQEYWMAAHLDQVGAPVLIGVGAAFDFLSGQKRQAPLWMQRCGMEWLFRFLQEPRRLWPRYRHYPRFIWLLFAQTLGFQAK